MTGSTQVHRLDDTVHLFTARKELQHLKMLVSETDPGIKSPQTPRNNRVSLGYDYLTPTLHFGCIVLFAL